MKARFALALYVVCLYSTLFLATSRKADATPPSYPQAGLVSYWSFDEVSGLALDPISGNNGILGAGAMRIPGLVGPGAIAFNNQPSSYVDVGPGVNNSFSVTTGVTIAAVIKPQWSGNYFDYDEIFRKEDFPGLILLSFQNDGGGFSLPNIAGGPNLSFGIRVGGVYSELDMPLDGLNGRPTLADLKDGQSHRIVATYDSSSGVKAIYIDGTLRYSVNLGAGNLISSGGPAHAVIGNHTYLFEPFSGTIDEVAFYNRALTATEIAGLEDATPPVISEPDNIVATATSSVGATVHFAPTATDETDGDVSVICSPASGSTFPIGTTTVTCTAMDAAGNVGTASFTVTVVVSWSGILQPINPDGSSVFKLGSTVPVKFKLTGDSAGITNLNAKLYLAQTDTVDLVATNEAVSTSASDIGNTFRYDSTAGQYIFNLSTKNLAQGTWYLRIVLGDGVSHIVQIKLKK